MAATLKRYSGMIHGFLNVGGAIGNARPSLDDAVAALRKAYGT